ncbi:tyrosine-type recombinase/integrase [Falsiroseomonas oryzae]|uniref:tyrosine-type recombinase/integrase n=1 Tax=Falsiroseomonas oryzae TaxID=2766473 RepID=UPI0022EB68CE|nr:site-specific integrase [Roseomonas sp. MO-31]
MTNLTVAEVKAARHSGRKTEHGKVRPERISDAHGLYLQLAPGAEAGKAAGKSWLFRYSFAGKAREMGLGKVSLADDKPGVTLGAARRKVTELHAKLRDGIDPIAERDARFASAKAEAQAAAARTKTFREVTDLYLAAHEATWKNVKHRQQWENTLATYAFPHFGDRPVADVDTAAVLAALEPIWKTKTETATRLRQRIETVLDFATPRGWRSGENPARWRGHLEATLPKPGKIAKVEHHAALPWAEAGAFMVALRQREGVAARALEFGILTAARSGEVRGARWSEIDLARGVWVVPGDRMKAGREHRVPLSAAAVAILRTMADLRDAEAPDPLVFPGLRQGKPLSENTLNEVLKRMKRPDLTVHGFRSTFRDWAAERSQFPRELAEKALAHVLGDATEAAYQRGDMFEKRRRMMDAWAEFCARAAKPAEVVPLRAAGA